jgi:hypothetical protein
MKDEVSRLMEFPKTKLPDLVEQASGLQQVKAGQDAHSTRGSWIFFDLEAPN